MLLDMQTVPQPQPLLPVALSLGAGPNLTFYQDPLVALGPILPQDDLVFPGFQRHYFQRQSHSQVLNKYFWATQVSP